MLKTIRKQNKMATKFFGGHWKTELQNFWYSNVLGIPIFGIQAPTVVTFPVYKEFPGDCRTIYPVNKPKTFQEFHDSYLCCNRYRQEIKQVNTFYNFNVH